MKDAWSWERKVGLADATGTRGSQSPLPSPGCYPPRLPGTRHTGWLSGEEGNSLSPLPGPALVPGQAIFGPPRPVLDKKGTAVGPFHPRGTHCSIRGLTYGLPDPRAQVGGYVHSFLKSPCPGSGERQPMACVQHTPNAESRCSWGLGLLMDNRTARDTHSHCCDSSLPSDQPQLKRARENAPKGGRDS